MRLSGREKTGTVRNRPEEREEEMTEAVIFDLDGTILDNEQLWEEAFVKVMKKQNLKISLRQKNGWKHEPGLGLTLNWRNILAANEIQDPMQVRKTVSETVKEYNDLNQDLKLREGVEEVVETVKQRGWRTALSTGSDWFTVEKELEELGLMLAFEVTTTGEEVYLPKPDPEIYVLTGQKLGIEPENCLVVEDSVAGARSALEAGMRVAAIKSAYADEATFKALGVQFIVKDFNELKEIISNIE